MKLLGWICALVAGWVVVSVAQARETEYRKVDVVNSAAFVSDRTGTTIKLNYSTGGCRPESNAPKVELEHVSTKDVTPKWALDENPNQIHEYNVVMKVVLKEVQFEVTCMMAYDIDVVQNLDEVFKQQAPKLGIDLPAKKAHYSVEFLAPEVRGSTHFSAF